MEMTLVKSLHSCDPEMIQTQGLAIGWHLGCVTCTWSAKINCMLILVILHLSFPCWLYGCHRLGQPCIVPNCNSIRCSNSSLLQCLPVTQAARVRFLDETCLPRSALQWPRKIYRAVISATITVKKIVTFFLHNIKRSNSAADSWKKSHF